MQPPVTVFSVGAGQSGLRLDQYIKDRIPAMSRRRVQQAIGTRVTLLRAASSFGGNPPEGMPTLTVPVEALPDWLKMQRPAPGRRLRVASPVRAGDRVILWPEQIDEPDEAWHVPVLYEDSDLAAVDKPAGLVVHANRRRVRNTLVGVLRRQREGEEWSLAHRLDRETSGVVLLARNRGTARRLSHAFARGEVSKTYLAVVHGRPEAGHGSIDRPLGADQVTGIHVRRAVVPDGARAVTEYSVICSSGEFSLLAVRPRTGRRHQIRVHLESIGHSIVGDKLYGEDPRWYVRTLERGPGEEMMRALLAGRQLLHAAALGFSHPACGRAIHIRAPLPADMRKFLEERGMDLGVEGIESIVQRRSSTAVTIAPHGQ